MEIEPTHIETHAAGYPYERRFRSLKKVHGAVGGAVYSGEGREGFALISDEGTMLDFLGDPEELDLVTIRIFETREARDAFFAQRYGSRPRAPDAPDARGPPHGNP